MAGISVHGGAQATANPRPGSPGYLRWYWTKSPEGLAKWATSAHPYAALHRHLLKYMSKKMADRVANVWYHAVFGKYPTEGKHKVGHHYV